MTDWEDLRRLAHHDGWSTEFEALYKVSKTIKAMRVAIVHALLVAGDAGLTPDEYCDRIGGLINTVRRRFTDLWQEGVIRHHPLGLTRRNGNGNACVAWVIGRDEAAVATARRGALVDQNRRLREEVARLRAILQEHGITDEQTQGAPLIEVFSANGVERDAAFVWEDDEAWEEEDDWGD